MDQTFSEESKTLLVKERYVYGGLAETVDHNPEGLESFGVHNIQFYKLNTNRSVCSILVHPYRTLLRNSGVRLSKKKMAKKVGNMMGRTFRTGGVVAKNNLLQV